jgi:hypothetical protein
MTMQRLVAGVVMTACVYGIGPAEAGHYGDPINAGRDVAPAQDATQAPNPDTFYKLGPDSLEQDGVPKGEMRGPFTLPSVAYPGTQHTYWVYVPAQYTRSEPASLMIFNDGQAFKNPTGNIRAHNVLDNLMYRREIPVMIAVFINPGRTPEQPEPTPQNWGDKDTNRPTEYNTLDDRYARVIVNELLPALEREFNISKDPTRRGIGGASSGAIAAFGLGAARRLPQGSQHRRQLHQHPRRSRLPGSGAHVREEADPRVPAGRAERQSCPASGRDLRSDARLVLPERPVDGRADEKGLRR